MYNELWNNFISANLHKLQGRMAICLTLEQLEMIKAAKVSDIIHSACSSSSPTDSYNLTKDQAEEMYLKVEGLATQRVIKSHWRFLRYQMHLIRSVKLKKFLSHLLLYSMIKLIYKSIIIPLSVSKSKVLLAQIEKGESFKIDTTSKEGKAVIRHLGGWAIHSVLAELNRYIMLCASSRKQTVQDWQFV